MPGYVCELVVPYAPRRVLRLVESNLLTVPPEKPGKYGSRSFVRASANLSNSLREERAAWLKNRLLRVLRCNWDQELINYSRQITNNIIYFYHYLGIDLKGKKQIYEVLLASHHQ